MDPIWNIRTGPSWAKRRGAEVSVEKPPLIQRSPSDPLWREQLCHLHPITVLPSCACLTQQAPRWSLASCVFSSDPDKGPTFRNTYPHFIEGKTEALYGHVGLPRVTAREGGSWGQCRLPPLPAHPPSRGPRPKTNLGQAAEEAAEGAKVWRPPDSLCPSPPPSHGSASETRKDEASSCWSPHLSGIVPEAFSTSLGST